MLSRDRVHPLVTVAFLAVSVVSARAGTLHVTVNGTDGASCGAQETPCRSITRAIANAAAGDKIVVGPGRYDATVEAPAPGCGCMLAINKAVTLESSHGAGQTLIDGRNSPEGRTILVITDGGAFGKPGKGFLVTESQGGRRGMVLDATNVSIRGN